jgi:hypothetical protein
MRENRPDEKMGMGVQATVTFGELIAVNLRVFANSFGARAAHG